MRMIRWLVLFAVGSLSSVAVPGAELPYANRPLRIAPGELPDIQSRLMTAELTQK